MGYFVAAAAIVIAASLPYVLQEPTLIVRRVFGYGSQYGYWGLSRLAVWLGTRVEPLAIGTAFYQRYSIAAVFAAIVLVSFRMDRLPVRPSLYTQCGVIAFTFVFLTPGFGVQYLAWLVPWAVGSGPGPAMIYYATSGLFLFFVYWSWAQADQHLPGSLPPAEWEGLARYLEVLCWISVGVVLFLFLRRAGVMSHRTWSRQRSQ